MYHRNMIVGFIADSDVPQDVQDAIRARLLKHVHVPDGQIMAACLTDIFLNRELANQFTAAWEANPGKFMDMVSTPC